MSDHDLSNAYLRLRALIPGAYDTPHAPTPEQVWETTEAALRRVLQERADDARIRHPLTGDTWVLDGRTGRTREVVPATDDEARAREILEATDFHGERMEYSLRLGVVTEALAEARREERERCAQHIEARAVAIRDLHGPVTPEGLLTALAGAQVGALLDAAAALRGESARTGPFRPDPAPGRGGWQLRVRAWDL